MSLTPHLTKFALLFASRGKSLRSEFACALLLLASPSPSLGRRTAIDMSADPVLRVTSASARLGTVRRGHGLHVQINTDLRRREAALCNLRITLVGRALAREPHSNPLFEGVMTELWVDIVMPAVLTRTSSVANP